MSSLHAVSLRDNPHEKEETQVINSPSTMTLPRKTVGELDLIKRENRAKRSYAIRVSVIEGAASLSKKYAGVGQSNTENHSAFIELLLNATDLTTLQEFCAENDLGTFEGLTRWLSVMAATCRRMGMSLDWLTGEMVEELQKRA